MEDLTALPNSLYSLLPNLLLFIGTLLLVSCAAGPAPAVAARRQTWPPPETAARVVVYADHYHSIIALPRQPEGDEEWAFGERIWFYEEKDRDYLLRKEYFYFVYDVMRALFWPNAGVIQVTRSEKTYTARNPESKVSRWEIPVSAEGLERMRAYLDQSVGSRTALVDDGWQIYFPAAKRYHALHTCHHYVARALRVGGVPVRPGLCFWPSGLWWQLERLSRKGNRD